MLGLPWADMGGWFPPRHCVRTLTSIDHRRDLNRCLGQIRSKAPESNTTHPDVFSVVVGNRPTRDDAGIFAGHSRGGHRRRGRCNGSDEARGTRRLSCESLPL